MTSRTRIMLSSAAAVVAAGAIWGGINRSVVDKTLLVGTWTFVSGANRWGETTLTLSEDGKLQMTTQGFGKTYDWEGTYTVNRDTIEMLVVDNGDWGDAGSDDWARKGDGGRSDNSNTDDPPRQQSQQKEPQQVIELSVTIRSLSETELVVADEKGKEIVYSKEKKGDAGHCS